MYKYNIALVPSEKSQEIIELARLFSSISDSYLLGPSSLPHVTLYQFSADAETLDRYISKIKASNIGRSLALRFDEFSCISFDRQIYWASLMPDKVAELNEMHECVADLIGQPVKPNYDPHMTLMNTRQRDYESLVELVKCGYQPISDECILTIGESDAVGQYLRLICSV